jgi:hypothetical protein
MEKEKTDVLTVEEKEFVFIRKIKAVVSTAEALLFVFIRK